MVQHIETAKRILETNWKGDFTIPTQRLYPFQWNWDSGFVCLGHRHVDIQKAMKEMNALFSGQWSNGLLPHIVFHSENETTYFPNWDFWHSTVNKGAPLSPKTSGITQPAVHGFILQELLHLQHGNDEFRSFASQMFSKIVNYHRFLYQFRDPFKEGLMFIYHPWESGRDNSPLWDESLNRIQIKDGDIPAYERQDNKIAHANERPTQDQYDRYVYLLLLGKKYAYDGKEIAQESPFLIQDDMMNAILIKSNEGLIEVGKYLKRDTKEIEEWQAQSLHSFRTKLWNPHINMYTSYDLHAKKQIVQREIGGIIPLFSNIPNTEQATLIQSYLYQLHESGYYMIPSFDVDSPYFDSKRYWRGPVWPHMNWMIYKGLKLYGNDQLANIVKNDTFELIEKWGFYEYFEPNKSLAGQLSHGYGGESFSWTSSTFLDLLSEDHAFD